MKIAQKPHHCPDLCGAKEKQEKGILSWNGQMMVEPHTTEVALECLVVELGNLQGCNLPRKHEVKPTFRTTDKMHPQTLR